METFKLYPKGDRAITVHVGHVICKETNDMITTIIDRLHNEHAPGIIDIIPTYTTVTINYDWHLTSYMEVKKWVEEILVQAGSAEYAHMEKKEIEIPVCYSEKFGPDLGRVAKMNHMSKNEVIQTHTTSSYLIHMMGFLPGFPYLGGLDPSIATPRLDQPRFKVEAGSVGIAAGQTGVYSVDSPGGWNIIGKTPVALFDQSRENPFLLKQGDYITFVAIDEEEFYSYEM